MNSVGCGRSFVSRTNSAMTDQLVPALNAPGGDLTRSLELIPCPDRADRPYAVSACGTNGDPRTLTQSAPWIAQDRSLSCPTQTGTIAPPNARNAMSTTLHEVPAVVHLRRLLLSSVIVLPIQHLVFLAIILNTLFWRRSIAAIWWNAQFHEWRIIRWSTGPIAIIRRYRILPWFVKPRPPPASSIAQPQHLLVERQVPGVSTSSIQVTKQTG